MTGAPDEDRLLRPEYESGGATGKEACVLVHGDSYYRLILHFTNAERRPCFDVMTPTRR